MKPKTPKRSSSLKHLSGITGYPLPAIEKAKAMGCPHIDGHNRANVAEFVAWMSDHADEFPKDSLKDQKLFEEVRRLKIANDLREGKTFAREPMLRELSTAHARIRNELEQKLLNEFPAALAGLQTPGEVREKMKVLFDELLLKIQACWDNTNA